MPGGDKPAITPFDALAAKAKQAANQRQEADKAKLIENNRGGGSTSSGDSKSLTEDEYNTGMDMGIPSSQLLDPLTNENQLFADNQTGLSQVNAALTGGLMKGGLTLLENAGYLGDVKGMLDSTDDMDNWLSEMARSGKEWVDKELPIYRQSPSEVWDLDDPAWYAQQIQGLVDSGVGFTLTGFGAGAIAGKLANTFAKAVSMGVKGEQYMSTLGSAVMTNYAESKMMGLETYDKVYKTALANGKSDEEAQQLGKDAGKEVIINNKVNIITDALQLDLLFKTPKLASAATLPKENWLLTAGKASLSESAEEVSSGAIQTVAEEQGISKAMSQKPRDASEIAKEYLTSSQAGLEATLGAIGGQAQKGGIYGAKKVGEATGILSKPPTAEPVAPTKTYQDLENPGEFTKDEVKVRAENPGDKPLSPLERMMAANPKMDEKEAKMKTSSDTHAQNAYKASLSVWNKKNDAYQKEVKASDEYATAKTDHETKVAEFKNNEAEKAKHEEAMKQHALDVKEYERHHGTAPEKLKSKIKDALANNEVFALEKAKAFRNGDFIKAKQIDDNIFTDLTASVFSTGRSESLKEQLKAVIEDPNTDPRDKNNAREYLTKLPEMETSYNVLADKHGQKVGHQLFILDQRKKSTQEAVTKLAEKQDPIKNKLTVQIAGGEQLAMSYEQKELISLSSEIDAIENNIKDATKAAFEGGTDNSITEALTKKIESFRKRKNELENTISEMKIDKVSNEILNRYDSLEELEKLATDKSDLYYASLIYDRQYKSLASPNFIKNVENKTKSHFIDRASNASSSVELEMLSKQIQGSSLKENDKTALMDVIAKRLPGIRENEDSTSHKNVMREETKNKVSYIKAKLNNEIDNANADLSDTMSKMFENFMSKIGSPLTEETKEVNKKAKSGKPSTDKTSSAILKAMAEVDNVADTAALLAHGPSGKDKVAKMKRGVAKAIQKEEQKETHPEVVLPGDSLPLGKVTKGTGKMKSARLGAPLPPLEDVAPLVQDEYGNDANTPPEYWEGPTGLLEGEVDEVYELQQLNTELGILQNQELDMTPVPNTEIAPTSSLIVNPEPLSDDDSTVVPLTVVYTNITDLARKGKYDPEVDAFERWVENPRINKVGKKVLLSINFDYLAEQDAKRKAAGKTSYVYNNILSKSAIDLTSFDLPVTMTVVDENNEPIKIGEVELKAYLRDNTRKDISEADKAEIRKIKMAVYDAYIKGDKVYSKVSSISGGKLLHDTTGQLETPVLSLKPFFRDGVFNILLGDQAGLPGLFKNEKDFDRDFVNTTPKNGGFAYLPVKSANGRPYPLRLNLSRVGEDNAHALYDIFTRMTQGVKSSDYIDGVEGFDGLTYAEAISMIAFEGPKSATTGFPLHFSNTKKAKTVTFGDTTISHEAFLTPERRADFVQTVSNMWSPVDKKRINKSLWDSENGIKSRTFTFLGKVYDKSEGDKSYNEFIAERGVIHSNAYEENGAIFKSPVVTLAMPYREKGSPVATSTAEEVAKVESTQPTNSVTSPSIEGIEIPFVSKNTPEKDENVAKMRKDANNGWKLHLSIAGIDTIEVEDTQTDENLILNKAKKTVKILEELKKKGVIRDFKVGKDGGQNAKNITVYVGDSANVDSIVSILSKNNNELGSNIASGNLPLVKGISARFNVQDTTEIKSHGQTERFQRYGNNGIPRRHQTARTEEEIKSSIDTLEYILGDFFNGSSLIRSKLSSAYPELSNILNKQSITPNAPITTEASKGRDRFKGVTSESAADNIKAPLNSVYRGPVSKVDTEQELEWLKEVLPNVPVRVQDTLLGTGDNQKAEGMFYNGMITLSRAGNKGVAYHEAFHAVSQMYLSPTEMAAMYDTVRSEEGLLEGENGLRSMTNLECEEHLAEEFRKYMLNQKPHSNKAIQWLFDQIEKLVNLFKGNKARIFSRIRRGAYNYMPVFNTEAKLYSKVNLNATELKALIDITSYLSITKGLNIDELNKDIDAVNEGLEDDNKQAKIESVNALYEYIGGMLYNTAEKFAAEGRAQEADIINRGLDNWDMVIEEVKDNIKRFNLKELSEDEMEAVESASGENYSKASYQFDGKNNASGRVKFRVAMLPTAENSIIGLPSFANMAHSWNTLKKELGGLVDDSQSTGYEKMVAKLTSLVKDFPQYSEILDDLLNPTLDKFHSEFFVAMTGQINTFSATTVVKTKTGMKVKVFNADTQSQRYHVRNAWIENFNEKFLDEEGKIKNAEGLMTLSERYGEIKVKDNVQEARSKAIAALNYIGINVSEEAFDRYVNNQKGSTYANRLTIAVGIRGLGSLLNKKSTINNIHKAVSDLTYDHTDKSVIQDNTQIMKLAEAQADLSYLPGDSTVVSSQGTAYIFSQNNNISKFISALKSDPEGTLHVLNNRQYNESSRWLDWLSKKEDDTTIINDKGEEELLVGEYLNIKNFNSETFLSLRKENSDDEGSSYSDLIAIDELVDRINRTLQGHYSPLTFADKSTQINFTGPSLYKTNTKFDGAGNIVLSDNGNTTSIFTDYLMTELRRVSMVYDHIYGNEERGAAPISDNEKVQFFHTKGKDGLIGGLKLQFFAELTWKDEYKDPSTIPALYKELITKIYDKNGRPNLSGLKDGNTTFNRYVEHILNKEINVTKERVFSTGVITTKGIEAIDSTVKDKYIGEKNGDVASAASSIIADYTVNAMIANIEFTKIFSGDPAFYKSLDDLKKRAPASIAPGTDLRLKNMSDAETKFNIAVLNDEEHKSELYDEYLKIYSKTMGVEKATELLSPYKKVNEADAQAYITPDRFRFIMDRLGKWTADHDAAFEKMMKGEDVNPADLALMQPLKGVLFQQRDINLNGDVFGVPMYLKYSQAVLFPGMIKGTKLQDVYDKMVAPNAKIDELIFNSGVKVGAEGQANIFDDQYHPITLNNTNWKLQQDLPSKYWAKGYALEGSQVKKVIQANIVPTEMYGDMTGSDILNELSSLETQLSDLSLSELKDKWGVQMENGQVIKVNQMKLRKSIIKSLKDKDTPKNVIDALQRGEPFDAIPQFLDKIESELASAVTKAAVKLNMPGGSFVQLSNVGFEKKIGYEQLETRQRNDIIYLNEGKPLRGPRYEKDENGEFLLDAKGKKIFKPGEVFIPHKIVDTILGTAWHNMSAAEIKMHLKDAGLLDDLIGYRIPTQGPSSIDSLEIAGILPRSVGDTVVVYREITAKTGSDFDIDKMFIMMPNYTHVNGMFIKVPSDGTSKEALQNRKLELYKKILTSPNKFIELTKPLDAAWLKEDANYIAFISNEYKSLSQEAKDAFGLLSLKEKHSYIDKFNNNKTLSGLSFVSPIYQQDVKQSFNGGKNGVGQTANQLVDHILGQQAGLFIRKKLGVGRVTKEGYMDISQIYDVNGGMIVDNISAFLNAYVDIAKDPYVFDINNNTYTANVVFMLLRAGVDAKFINRLMSQPAIVELAKEHFAGESEIINPTLGGVDRRTQPYERVLAKRYGVSANSKIDLLAPLDLKGITSDFLEEQLLDEDPVFQARLLSTFLDLREAASSLAESIKASKTDTKGVGMNLAEATVTKELRDKIISEGLIGNFDKKFKGTNLETYTKNSIDFAQAVLGPLFISQSSQVYNSAKSIFKMIGDDYITDDELLKSIYKEFYAFSLSSFAPLQSTGEELDALLKGDKSVSNRLKLLKAHDKHKHNLLINTLSTRKGFKSAHSTITIAGTKKKDGLDSDSITAAWDDLLNSEHPNIKKFAEDLVKYSYITSGFKKNISSFFDLIPSGWLAQQGLTEYIEKIRSSNNTSTNNAFIDQFIRNHSDNYKLAPKVKLNDDTSYAPKKMSKDQMFVLNPKFYKYLEIGTDNKGRKIYKPYVTVGKKLFKCAGLDRNSNPVYSRVSKLGSSDPKTGRVIEYNPDNIDLKSVIDTVVSTVIPEGVIAATPEYQNFDVKKEDVTFDFILDTYPNYKDKEPVVKFTNINENFKIGEVIEKGKTLNVLQVEAGGVWKNLGDASDTKENALALGKLYLNDMGAKQWNELYYNLNIC